jgi:hypothetical protein
VIINVKNRFGNINILDELHRMEGHEGWVAQKVEKVLKEKLIPTIETLTSENAPRVQKKLRKLGEKLNKLEIDIPDIEFKIKKALNQVSDSINVNLEENADEIEKMKDTAIDRVNKVWENISGGWKDPQQDKKKKNTDTVEERSRLKILELLENGKITPDEAERLLKALGK